MSKWHNHKAKAFRKTFYAGVSLWGGIIAAQFLSVIINAACGFALIGVAAIMSKRHTKLSLCSLFVGIGILSYVILQYRAVLPAAALTNGEYAEYSGIITGISAVQNDLASYVIKLDTPPVSVTAFAEATTANPGDSVRFTAKFTLPKNNTNFNETTYYFSKGILLKATIKNGLTVTKNVYTPLSLTAALSKTLRDTTAKNITLNTQYGYLTKAIFLGDKSGLPDELKYSISRSGMSYVTAVSGMHLSIIVSSLYFFLRAGRLRQYHKTRYVVMLLLLLFLVVLFNFTMSVIRSAIMLAIYYLSEVLHEKSDSPTSAGTAILAVLLISPYAAFDAGFALSVAGVLAVGTVAPFFLRVLPIRRGGIAAALLTNTAAVVVTAPLCGLFFGQVAVLTPLVSLIVIPLAATELMCVCAGFLPIIGGAVWGVCDVCSRLAIFTIQTAAGVRYAALAVDISLAVITGLGAVAAIAALYHFYKINNVHFNNKHRLFKRVSHFTAAAVLLPLTAITTSAVKPATDYIDTFSDGNNGGVIIYRDKTSVITSDDSGGCYEQVRQSLDRAYRPAADVVIILSSHSNNVAKWHNISNNVILAYKSAPAENVTNDISANIKYDKFNKLYNVTVAFADCRISVVSVKSEAMYPQSGLRLLYGYNKSLSQANPAVGAVYAENRMFPDSDANAYYNRLQYKF